jgi:hypothetical protein
MLQEPSQIKKMINLQTLKLWVKQYLPSNSNLKILILSEDDIISSEEFIVKIDVWQKLLRMESNP